MDTIFALATAPGRAGVSIVRISGSDAFSVAGRLCKSLPEFRSAGVRRITGSTGELLDEAIVIAFEAGNSFTGEDVVELHLHGSLAVVSAVLTELSEIDGFRQAEAGEFTRRALENGRLDLTQVEALSDLIEAETEAQRRLASDVLSGSLGKLVGQWRVDLIRAAALLEATIDFADEEVPVDVTPEVRDLLLSVQKKILTQLQGVDAAERIRSGFEVAIVGSPNVGKSTLLNYLAGRDAAITSAKAGTTRDIIEVRMDIGGHAVTLIDTAGLRDSDDEVEMIGVDRARNRADQADVRLHLLETGEEPLLDVRKNDFVLVGKADQIGSIGDISGRTGFGVSEFLDRLKTVFSNLTARAGIASRLRHKLVLEDGLSHLNAALVLLEEGPDMYDVVSEEIRVGSRAMESLLGYVDVEHLLDEVFSSFCVGK